VFYVRFCPGVVCVPIQAHDLSVVKGVVDVPGVIDSMTHGYQ
jgi:hypothetical protein